MDVLSGRCLLPDGKIADAHITIDGAHIASVSVEREAAPGGQLVLPGAVDLHGDGFESWIMPRPGVFLPLRPSLIAADRAMAAAGITTAFLSPTLSWEPGLRSAATFSDILSAEEDLAAHRHVDTHIHLRYETGALDSIDTVKAWLADGRIGLLSINDHLALSLELLVSGDAGFASQAKRAGQSEQAYRDDLTALSGRYDQAKGRARDLLQAAVDAGVPAAWHDDQTADDRAQSRSFGALIADFPSAEPALEAAAAAGDPVIMGAPNAVRGGSHMQGKGVSAAKAVIQGWAGILASDYAYAALPQAAVALWRTYGLSFSAAWHTISKAPAAAVGLHDRGDIAEGQRADLVTLDITEPANPVITQVRVGGRLVLSAV